jgi:hypothetical protein
MVTDKTDFIHRTQSGPSKLPEQRLRPHLELPSSTKHASQSRLKAIVRILNKCSNSGNPKLRTALQQYYCNAIAKQTRGTKCGNTDTSPSSAGRQGASVSRSANRPNFHRSVSLNSATAPHSSPDQSSPRSPLAPLNECSADNAPSLATEPPSATHETTADDLQPPTPRARPAAGFALRSMSVPGAESEYSRLALRMTDPPLTKSCIPETPPHSSPDAAASPEILSAVDSGLWQPQTGTCLVRHWQANGCGWLVKARGPAYACLVISSAANGKITSSRTNFRRRTTHLCRRAGLLHSPNIHGFRRRGAHRRAKHHGGLVVTTAPSAIR